MDKRFKYKLCCHKSLGGEHTEENLRYLSNNIFINMSPKARDIKERINKWDFIEIKSFWVAKENNGKIKM